MFAPARRVLYVLGFVSAMASASPLKVYTDRPKDRLEKVTQRFTASTGLAVEVVSAPYAELKQKLEQGEVGDLLLTKDALTLADAARVGLYQPMNKNVFVRVPEFMRDPKGLWVALAYRVRSVIYDLAVVQTSEVDQYASLAQPEFKGRVCMRNAKEYMPALTAWMIVRFGEAETERILLGWRQNMAGDFTSGDSASIKEFESGRCAVTIGNHYYLARLKNKDSRLPVKIHFVDGTGLGVHTNGFGGGVLKASSQSAEAERLMEFLLSSEGQSLLVEDPSFEYPAAVGELPAPVVRSFGPFKPSEIPWSAYAENEAKARKLLDKVGWAK